MCIVEVLAAGPTAVAKRTDVMHEFALLIHENAHQGRRGTPIPLLTAETIVGGVYETIFRKIAADKSQELPELLPDVVEFTLLPVSARKTPPRSPRQRPLTAFRNSLLTNRDVTVYSRGRH